MERNYTVRGIAISLMHISSIILTILFVFPCSDLQCKNKPVLHYLNSDALVKNQPPDTTAPLINIWYGDLQTFGNLGNSQQWINILGKVSDTESDVVLLSYTLNNKPGPEIEGVPGKLMIGPHPAQSDPRRLYYKGDFNIEIDRNYLKNGSNRIFITAENGAGLKSNKTVIIKYHKGNVWPLPYYIDWKSVKNAQNVLQITDGLWRWDKSGIRPVRPTYDRVVAIGDVEWQDYEVVASITIHGIDESAYNSPVSVGPAFGITLRWQGHSERPNLKIPCLQPRCGWQPSGSMTWYIYNQKKNDFIIIGIDSDKGHPVKSPSIQIETGKTYWFRSRVKTIDNGYKYFFKVWEAGYKEPVEWSLQRRTKKEGLSKGAILVVFHHVDATLGSVTVLPVK